MSNLAMGWVIWFKTCQVQNNMIQKKNSFESSFFPFFFQDPSFFAARSEESQEIYIPYLAEEMGKILLLLMQP